MDLCSSSVALSIPTLMPHLVQGLDPCLGWNFSKTRLTPAAPICLQTLRLTLAPVGWLQSQLLSQTVLQRSLITSPLSKSNDAFLQGVLWPAATLLILEMLSLHSGGLPPVVPSPEGSPPHRVFSSATLELPLCAVIHFKVLSHMRYMC